MVAAYPTSAHRSVGRRVTLLWLRTTCPSTRGTAAAALARAPGPADHATPHVNGLRIGDTKRDIDIDGDHFEITGNGDLEVIGAPRPPLTSLLQTE